MLIRKYLFLLSHAIDATPMATKKEVVSKVKTTRFVLTEVGRDILMLTAKV